MSSKNIVLVLISLIITTLLLIGCGPSPEAIAIQTATAATAIAAAWTATPTTTSTFTPTPTHTFTPTTTPTDTPTPVPPTATPTNTPSPTATPTSTSTHTPTPIPPTATSIPTTGQMRGQAFWTDTDKPIANLEVTLALGESETKIITDTQGKYAFTELKPGAYTLSVIWEFGQFSALPCSNFSLKTPLEGSWMALTGTQADGDHVLIAIGPETKIAAGDRAEVNLEFSCN